MARSVLQSISNTVKGAHMMNPTAFEFALINLFIVILIVLEGIAKIKSKKSNDLDPA